MVEHSAQHHKIQVSSLAAAVGTDRENCEKTTACVFDNSKHKHSNFLS